MAVVLGWLIAAFICAYVAKEKNRNVAMWAVLGGVFGLFTLAVLVFLPTLKKPSLNTKHVQKQIRPTTNYAQKTNNNYSPNDLI